MTTYAQAQANKKFHAENAPTHFVDSGMGGVFNVRLIKQEGAASLIRMVDSYWKGTRHYLSEYEAPSHTLTSIGRAA